MTHRLSQVLTCVLLFSGSLNGLTRDPIQFRQPDNALLAWRSWFEYRGEKLYFSGVLFT